MIAWTRRIVVALFVAAGLAGTASAQAAPGWLAPAEVTPPSATSISSVGVAIARDGTQWVIWTRSDGANGRVEVASRAPGTAAFSAVKQLSAAGQSASSPTIKVDRQGNVTAAWLRFNGAVFVAQAAYHPAGGDWGTVQDLSDTTISTNSLDLAVGDSGNAAVVWNRQDGAVPRAETTIRPPGSPIFGSRTLISPAAGTGMCPPQVAMDAAGDVVALWQRLYDVGGGTSRWVMESNTKANGASWALAGVQSRSRTDVGQAGSCTYDVAMTAEGRALAIWDYNNGNVTPGSTFVEYTERTANPNFAGGSWGGRQRASASTQNAQVAQVAFDDRGDAVARWTADNGAGSVLQAATREQLGAFSAPKDLSGVGPGSITLAAAPTGDAMVTWSGLSGADTVVFSAHRAPGGDFGDVRTVALGSNSSTPRVFYSVPAVGVDDQGNAYTAMVRRAQDPAAPASQTYMVVLVPYDQAAPSITAVDVPSGAGVGQSVSMSAGASDRVSTAALSWSFGDGGSATGAGVAHAYGAPGAYTVTVNATDGAGNVSSTSRVIQIAAPQVSAGGIDSDHDGFNAGQDCNDSNAAIRPGALEIKGNNIDENCDGLAEPFPTLTSGVVHNWNFKGSTFTLNVLQITQVFPKGWSATIKCSGKRCPLKSKTLKAAKVKKNASSVIGSLSAKQRKFRAGQTVEIWISAPNFNTKVARIVLKKGKQPVIQALCVEPGQTKPKKSCS